MHRRKYLATVGGSGLVGLTGCLGSLGGGGGGFPSEDIRFIVGFGEGGGFDSYARAIAPIWEETLGGDVSVEVDNVTGAGGLIAADEMYNAEADGHTIGFLNVPGFTLSQFFRDVEYEMTEFTGIGTVMRGVWVLNAAPDRMPETWEDIPDMGTTTWGSTGIGGTSWFMTTILGAAMDADTEVVGGYDPLASTITGVLQGELDVAVTAHGHAQDFIEAGEIDIILAFGDSREPLVEGAKDAPLTSEIDIFRGLGSLNLSRIVGGPPGLPDDIRQTLDDTLWEVLQSDELAQWSDETGRALTGSTRGDRSEEIIETSVDSVGQYEDVIAENLDQ